MLRYRFWKTTGTLTRTQKNNSRQEGLNGSQGATVYAYNHIHIYIYIYICTFIDVYVYLFACLRARVCLCVCVFSDFSVHVVSLLETQGS